MARHHPSDEVLLAYAAGSSPEAVSLVVATHLALCPDCRAEVRRLEALGGSLVEALAPAPLPPGLLQRVLSRIDSPPGKDHVAATGQAGGSAATGGARLLPRPLRDYVGGSLDRLPWRRFGPFSLIELVDGKSGPKCRLLRIKPGTAIPRHAHGGLELALILEGGLSDEQGHYLRGDVSEADASVAHRQVTDPDEDCLCLVATDAPIRLGGLIGRLINPFIPR